METEIALTIDESINILLYNKFNDELKQNWEKVENLSDPFIYQRYSWNNYWSGIFAPLFDFFIIVVQQNETAVAVLPFCINKKGSIKKLQFIGGEQSDYLTPLISSDFELSVDIWTHVLKIINVKYDLIELEKIPESIKSQRNLFINLLDVKFSGLSFGIKLPGTYTEFDDSLKRSFRNDTRRNLKRLKEIGFIEIRKIDTSTDDHQAFDDFILVSIEQKARRLRNYMGNSLMENEYAQNFYKNSYLIKDKNYKLDYSVLLLNGSTVLATHWGFYDKERYYFVLPTMEGKEWYKYSCGKIIIDFLVKFSISEANSYFDLTIGDENYKKDWCNVQMKIYSYQKATSLKGYIYLLKKQAIAVLRQNKFAKSIWRKSKTYIVNSRKRK